MVLPWVIDFITCKVFITTLFFAAVTKDYLLQILGYRKIFLACVIFVSKVSCIFRLTGAFLFCKMGIYLTRIFFKIFPKPV